MDKFLHGSDVQVCIGKRGQEVSGQLSDKVNLAMRVDGTDLRFRFLERLLTMSNIIASGSRSASRIA